MKDLVVGKTYIVTHIRKGTFKAILKRDDKSTVDLEIVEGHAVYIAIANEARGYEGDTITVRKDFCEFKEVA